MVNNGENNVSVTEVDLDHGVSAGIRLRSIGNGMIPIFEEHTARIDSRLSLEEWDKLPYMERAMIIATHRVKNAISNLQQEAEIRESERKANKGRR